MSRQDRGRAYVGYDDTEETPSGETRLTVREASDNNGNYNNATGYCTITAGSILPAAINCTATVPMLGYRGHPHMTISNYMTNITD
jgi:hypothetical protein